MEHCCKEMNYFRITKYNPKYRDDNGAYTLNDWTSIYDIGNYYNGMKLTNEKYQEIENLYVNAIILTINYLEILSMKIINLEVRDYDDNGLPFDEEMYNTFKSITDCDSISIENIGNLVKMILRENLWGKIVCDDLEIHFGYDYYMYFCVKEDISEKINEIEKMGLFVENIKSPHICDD